MTVHCGAALGPHHHRPPTQCDLLGVKFVTTETPRAHYETRGLSSSSRHQRHRRRRRRRLSSTVCFPSLYSRPSRNWLWALTLPARPMAVSVSIFVSRFQFGVDLQSNHNHWFANKVGRVAGCTRQAGWWLISVIDIDWSFGSLVRNGCPGATSSWLDLRQEAISCSLVMCYLTLG